MATIFTTRTTSQQHVFSYRFIFGPIVDKKRLRKGLPREGEEGNGTNRQTDRQQQYDHEPGRDNKVNKSWCLKSYDHLKYKYTVHCDTFLKPTVTDARGEITVIYVWKGQ